MQNNIIHPNQFAYVAHKSTVVALHKMLDDIYVNVNNGLLTGLCKLDLRKGFDSLNHTILLHKLSKYGINDNSNEFKWFQSYICERSQIVKCNRTLSTPMPLKTGVCQGTILGPILFLLYVNDMFDVTDTVNCIMYADDTTLYCNGVDSTDVELKLQRGIDAISEWLQINRLVVNSRSSKSSTMVIGTKNKCQDVSVNVTVSGLYINYATSCKLLGVTLDSNLTWSEHLFIVARKLSKKVGILYRLSKILSPGILNVLYMAIVQPDIDYCISVWGNAADIYVNTIQKLQNRAARIISNCFDWNVSSAELIANLNWMPVKMRKDYFVSIFMYKVVNGIIHVLEDHVHHVVNKYTTRAVCSNNLAYRKPNLKLFESSLQFYGAHIWNSLPINVREAQDICTFKKLCKAHLVQCKYYN